VIIMKNIDAYISLLEELKEIRSRIDKMEKMLNSEIERAGGRKGVSMTDILELQAPLRTIVLELTKSGNASSSDLSGRMGMANGDLVKELEVLEDMGYITEIMENGEKRYQIVLSRKQSRKVHLDLWNALDKKVGR
jgi:hypothetical protein